MPIANILCLNKRWIKLRIDDNIHIFNCSKILENGYETLYLDMADSGASRLCKQHSERWKWTGADTT